VHHVYFYLLHSSQAFFADFSAAFQKLQELGTKNLASV
jgi:hypothetical protein